MQDVIGEVSALGDVLNTSSHTLGVHGVEYKTLEIISHGPLAESCGCTAPWEVPLLIVVVAHPVLLCGAHAVNYPLGQHQVADK